MSPTQTAARLLYIIGSLVFLVSSLHRGSLVLATGSTLFLLGSLLLFAPVVREARRRPAARSRER